MATLPNFTKSSNCIGSTSEMSLKIKEKIKQNSNIFKLIRKKKKLAYNPKFKQGRWTEKEHKEFIKGILKLGKNNWIKVILIYLFL